MIIDHLDKITYVNFVLWVNQRDFDITTPVNKNVYIYCIRSFSLSFTRFKLSLTDYGACFCWNACDQRTFEITTGVSSSVYRVYCLHTRQRTHDQISMVGNSQGR